MFQVSPSKKDTRKKCGETVWKSRMTPSVAQKLDEQRKKMQRELREVERLSLCKKTSWSQCSINCKRLRKRGTISCLSTKGHKRGHKRYQASRTREKYAERELGGKRGNAENQKRNCVEGRALHTAVGQRRQKHNVRCGNGSRASGTASWRRKKRQ